MGYKHRAECATHKSVNMLACILTSRWQNCWNIADNEKLEFLMKIDFVSSLVVVEVSTADQT